MDILHSITKTISALPAGEKWEITAQNLWLSHADFQSISVYLCRESEKGHFSITNTADLSTLIGNTSLWVTKH